MVALGFALPAEQKRIPPAPLFQRGELQERRDAGAGVDAMRVQRHALNSAARKHQTPLNDYSIDRGISDLGDRTETWRYEILPTSVTNIALQRASANLI
ncbi:hypothetical protein AB4084_01885 [Lysobacter sp. 2RAB21]